MLRRMGFNVSGGVICNVIMITMSGLAIHWINYVTTRIYLDSDLHTAALYLKSEIRIILTVPIFLIQKIPLSQVLIARP